MNWLTILDKVSRIVIAACALFILTGCAFLAGRYVERVEAPANPMNHNDSEKSELVVCHQFEPGVYNCFDYDTFMEAAREQDAPSGRHEL
mgnify:CR=1 FL=1